MNFGNIVGGLLQQGLSSRNTNQRAQRGSNDILGQMLGGAAGGQSGQGGGLGGLLGGLTGGQSGQAGGGLGGMLGGLLGGQSTSGSGGGLGGLLGGGGQTGSPGTRTGGGNVLNQLPQLSAGQGGGLGAVLGAVLMGQQGRGVGAVKGAAMGMVASLALKALRERQAKAQPVTQQHLQDGTAEQRMLENLGTNRQELDTMTSDETARLVLRGMLEAAKADGKVTPDEMQRILSQAQSESPMTDEDRRFVLEEMNKPADLDGLVRDIPSKEVGAEVYAAALMAIEVDTPQEKAFLEELSRKLGLNDGTDDRLKQMLGVS